MLHAGCNSGFLDDCSLILDNQIQHRDYHKNMNGDIFKTWVEKQLVPGLNKIHGQAVVIMDNAPYHSMRADKRINSNSRKHEMEDWLNANNVAYDQTATKKNLWNDFVKPMLGTDSKKNMSLIIF